MDDLSKNAIFAPCNYRFIKKMNFLNKALASFLMVLMAMIASVSVAQDINQSNLTGSPYSRYGYGKMGSLGNASTKGMGDLGIALRSNNYTTIANPASLTAIDTLTMIFSVGLDADYSHFQENGLSERNWDGGFSYMTFHFPLWRNFAMSLSLTPYSMVGYNYGNVDKKALQSPINKHDTLSIASVYNGVGGVNNFMMGVGYRPFSTKMKELNVGVNAGYLFGSISHSVVATTTSQANSTAVTHEMTVRGLMLQFGAQYTHRLNATRSLTVGATFQPKLNLAVNTEELKLSTDTIQFGEKYRNDIKSPMKVGFGVSYNVARQLTASAEYEFTQWSKVNGFQTDLSQASDVFTDTHRIAVGAEYIPRANSNKLFQVCRYRLGFNTKNSYMLIDDVKLREYAVSAGMSMPVNRRCFLDLAIGYSRLQPSVSNMLKENYLNITLGVTFNEMMFFRNKLR